MSDTESIQFQGIIITTHGDSVAAPSIDLTEYGVLYVDTEGYTSLMPWHRVARVAFFDEVAAPVDDAPYVPERHEGSE